MGDLSLLVWLTQLGVSVSVPLAGYIILGMWLHESCNWGRWTVWVGIFLGIVGAIGGLRDTIRSMDKIIKKRKPKVPPPPSFNDHN